MSRLDMFISYADSTVLRIHQYMFHFSVKSSQDPAHSWQSQVSSVPFSLSFIPTPRLFLLGWFKRQRTCILCSDLVLTWQCWCLWNALLDLDTEAVWCEAIDRESAWKPWHAFSRVTFHIATAIHTYLPCGSIKHYERARKPGTQTLWENKRKLFYVVQ
jgi:hypothetical protein